MELLQQQTDLSGRTRRFTRKLVRGLSIATAAIACYFFASAGLELFEGTGQGIVWFLVGGGVSSAICYALGWIRV